MVPTIHFTSVRFSNYKAFKKFSVSLRKFNILVGPNNSGKSTILGAFRILAEGVRKARSRKPALFDINGVNTWAYRIDLNDLPVSTENVFTDYDESNPATIDFRLSNGNHLKLVFPERGDCLLTCDNTGKPVRAPSDFKRIFPVTIGFVPILGPVDHDEPLYQKEAARKALLSHRASRNFRNIWFHFSDDFEQFRELISSTWPGMDIEKPVIEQIDGKPKLYMFCPEERYPREIYWAGFGFQVWCQMLTYTMRSVGDSLLIIDEPDIYLHSDLQRQLMNLLEGIGPDILIATHSTEIITEAEPGDLLVVNKRSQSAKRLKDPSGLQHVFEELGSNLNPTLTQLAKSRRALFVEGKDFQILAALSRKLNKPEIANRSDFAVIPVEGFNPTKVKDFSKGIEITLGGSIVKGVIFDRDYRSENEIKEVERELKKISHFAHIHRQKEIENYLLIPDALERSIQSRVAEQNIRTGNNATFSEDLLVLLDTLTSPLKHDTSAQYLSKRVEYEKSKFPGTDNATITASVMREFDDIWDDISKRLAVVPGKQVFASLNQYLQENYDITIAPTFVANQLAEKDIFKEIKSLISTIDEFRKVDA